MRIMGSMVLTPVAVDGVLWYGQSLFRHERFRLPRKACDGYDHCWGVWAMRTIIHISETRSKRFDVILLFSLHVLKSPNLLNPKSRPLETPSKNLKAMVSGLHPWLKHPPKQTPTKSRSLQSTNDGPCLWSHKVFCKGSNHHIEQGHQVA